MNGGLKTCGHLDAAIKIKMGERLEGDKEKTNLPYAPLDPPYAKAP